MATSSKPARRASGRVTKQTNECRVCLDSNSATVPIFGDKNKPDISTDITVFGAIHLDKEDLLPKYICKNCYNLLQNAITFRVFAKRADALLKRRLKNAQRKSIEIHVKLESVMIDEHEEKPKEILDEQDIKPNLNQDSEGDLKIEDSLCAIDCNEDNVDYGAETDNETKSYEVSIEKNVYVTTCMSCKLEFKLLHEFEQHCLTAEHKEKIGSISPKKRTLQNKDVKKIKKMPAGPKDQNCSICNKVFTKFMFPRHIKEKHGIKPGQATKTKECPVCKKLFRPDYVSKHIQLMHTENKEKAKPKVECPVCKKMFAAVYYPVHAKKHDQENAHYVCDQCGKKFVFLSSFCNHRLIHTNDLPHKCEYCPYRGRSKHLLRIHVRTHTGNYPYKCDLCEVRCITKSNLNRHMRKHQGTTSFNCDTCNRGFYSKHELEKHVSVIHMGIRNHICNMCGVAFGYKHGLTKHLRKVHKKAKGEGKAKATYLILQEQGLLEKDTT